MGRRCAVLGGAAVPVTSHALASDAFITAKTAALSRSTRLQAGIGSWTIDSALLGPDLVRAIHDDRGFVCVDLHPPTEVDALATMGNQGGRVHVYYEDIPTFTDQGRKEPPCLLREDAVVLVEGRDRGTVGGQPQLDQARHPRPERRGLARRPAHDSSALFAAAADYLSRMKGIAEPFDVAKVDFYKALQRKMSSGLVSVMELEAEDGRRQHDDHGVWHRP